MLLRRSVPASRLPMARATSAAITAPSMHSANHGAASMHQHRESRVAHPAARFLPLGLHCLHTHALRSAPPPQAQQHAAATASSSSGIFPAAPDVDLSAGEEGDEESADARAAAFVAAPASISAASLAAYYDLLPPEARPALVKEKQAESEVVEEEYVVEHAPLRTRLKSDRKHALPRFDRHRAVQTLPFPMPYFHRMLQTPFVCEQQADKPQQHAGTTAQVCAKTAGAATPLLPHADSPSHPAHLARPPVMVDKRARSASATKPASQTQAQQARAVQADAELDNLRALLATPGHFLRVLHTLHRDGQHQLIARAYRQLVEPQVSAAISKLDGFIARRTHTPAAAAADADASADDSSNLVEPVDSTSASSALAFVHSIQNPPFLDSATSVSISAALSAGDNKLAKSAFASLMRLQQRQHECFELYLWDLGMQIMQDAHRAPVQPQLSSNQGVSDGSVDSASPLALTSSTSSSSSLARQFLQADKPFNPFHAKPYVQFIATLMRPAKGTSTNGAEAATAEQKKADGPAPASTAPQSSRRHRRRAARRAAQSVAKGLTPVAAPAELPKVKPALQLFNRLLEQPSTASLVLPGQSGSASAAISSPTSFRFSWTNLSRNMLSGVVDVAAHEVHSMQRKYGVVLEAAERAERSGVDASTRFDAATPTAQAIEAFDALPEADMLSALEELARKKSEALELLSGISMHILQSFVRNVQPNHAHAQPTPKASAARAAASSPSGDASGDSRTNSAEAPAAAAASPSSSSVASYTTDNLTHKHWHLIKLMLCESVTPAQLLDNGPVDSSSRFKPGQWRNRALHTMSAAEVRDQRQQIRAELLSLFPGLITPDLIDRPSYHPSPALQRDVFAMLRHLQDAHLKLVHVVLESYIQLAHAFAPLEARMEALRTRLEIKLARRGRHLAELEAAEPSTGTPASAEMVERRRSHKASLARLHGVALPPSPVRSVESLLTYMNKELIMPRPHTFTLLFHKGLFGGGIKPGVRYASSHPMSSTAAAAEAAAAAENAPYAVRPSGGDAGSEVNDLRMLQSMLTNCGPAFRRVPSRVAGASKDLISGLIISVALPRPVSLYTPARLHQQGNRHAEMHQPHNKLFEAFSTAALNVLEKQRRRSAKEDAIHMLSGTHASQLAAANSLSLQPQQQQALMEANGGSTHPFELVRDQSGLLSSLLGALEYVHSHPVRKQIRDHVRTLVHRATDTQEMPSLYSRRLLAARTGLTSERILSQVGPEQPLLGWQVHFVRRALRRGRIEAEERTARFRELQAEWRERDKAIFGKWNRPREIETKEIQSSPAISLVQVERYVVPSLAYNGLLQYYARTNNLAAALNCYDQMRNGWVSPSFEGSLALVQLAAKYMNYESLAFFMQREAIPLSRHSPSKRAKIWHELITGFTRYNTYSNIDVYMHYLHRLLSSVAPKHVAAKAEQKQQQQQMQEVFADEDAAEADANASSTSSSATAASQSATSSRSIGSASGRKRQLDHLWESWVSRGGAMEILAVWDSIRAQQAEPGKEQKESVLDGASVDHFLNGVLHESSFADGMGALTGAAASEACGALLRHMARHSLTLSTQQVQRIAVDLPLFVAASRMANGGPVVAPLSASDADLRALLRDSFASELSWRNFCVAYSVPMSVRSSIAQRSEDEDCALAHQVQAQLRDAAAVGTTAFFQQAASAAAPHTRSAVRTSVLAALLRALNAAVGPAGIDHALNKLDALVSQTKTQAHAQPRT